MMKAIARGRDGTQILLIGLSHANLDRLRADGLKSYIKVNGDEIGWPGYDIMITAGETEAAMAEAFADRIGPDTKVHISKRMKQ